MPPYTYAHFDTCECAKDQFLVRSLSFGWRRGWNFLGINGRNWRTINHSLKKKWVFLTVLAMSDAAQRFSTIFYGLVYFVRQYSGGCLHAAVAHEPSSGILYDYLVLHDGVPLLNLVV